MKKNILLVAGLMVLIFLFPRTSQAQIIIYDGPDAVQIRNLYAGSVVVLNDGYNKDYYYIEPQTQEKYYIRDDVTLLKMMRRLGRTIGAKNLPALPQNKTDKNANYNLVNKWRGNFLLQTDDNNTAWYINPLDNLRYKIEGGKNGLKTLQDLAINIANVQLNAINNVKNPTFTKNSTNEINFETFWQVQNTLKKNYYQPDKITDLGLFYGALQGLAEALHDPYTVFFTPQSKKNFDNRLEGSLEGIGAYVDIKNGKFTIISPLENSPAKLAGLLPNDQVLLVDNTDITGWLLEDTVNIIKGPSGTSVKLKIYRPATDATFELSIIRAKINIPTVESKKLDNNLAYFKFSIFSQDLPAQFAQARNSVMDGKTKGVIIDMRNNPGGFTSSAISLAEAWVPKDKLILRENYSNRSENFVAQSNDDINLPTVILINSGSASASEIFTLALSKNNLAKVVGEKSFGKGTGQSIVNFEDGSALKYTVFEWFGPKDSYIEGQGIAPDFVVQNTDNRDLQLEKAESLLR